MKGKHGYLIVSSWIATGYIGKHYSGGQGHMTNLAKCIFSHSMWWIHGCLVKTEVICGFNKYVLTFLYIRPCECECVWVWVCVCVCVCVYSVAQSCPTLCDPVDCSLPGSFVHGIFQARILEWVAISFSRASSPLRDFPHPGTELVSPMSPALHADSLATESLGKSYLVYKQ